MSEWVAVSSEETEEPVEIPTEADGTMLLTSVTAQFPGATGLKFRNPDTNTLRGVRMQGEVMFPPGEEGWGQYTYICVRPKFEDSPKKDEPRLKRKTESDIDMYSKNIKVDGDDDDDDPNKTYDLIILGLPWKTTEDDIREYFEPFGEILMIQLKKRPGTGESKGFGFIRFVDKDVEKKVLLQRHMIDGRWCDIKIPDSQERKDQNKDKTVHKIFVGRITENLTKEDIKDHFETFGLVTDVYIPTPFRHFCFVQFADLKVAQSLLGKEHMIKGVSVKIGEAAPKGRDDGRGRGEFDRGHRFGGYDGSYGGGRGAPMGGFGGGYGAPGGGHGGGYGGGSTWGSTPSGMGQYTGSGPNYGAAPVGGPFAANGGGFGGGGNSWSNTGTRHDNRRY